MRKNSQFLLTFTEKANCTGTGETGDGGWQRNIKMFPLPFHMQMEEDQGQTWSSATRFPMGVQKWENW